MHLKVKEIVRVIIVKIIYLFSSFCLNHSMLFYLIKFIFKIKSDTCQFGNREDKKLICF